MRYITGLLIGIVCFQLAGQAETPLNDHWKNGKITLNSGKILRGAIQYDLENEVVVLQRKGKMRAFGAQTVESFTVLDSSTGITHQYFTVPYTNESELPQLKFFRLVFDGAFTLFAREREVHRLATLTANYPMQFHPEDPKKAIAMDYYVFLPDGRFEVFQRGKQNLSQLLSLSEDEARKLNQFMIDSDIDLRRQTDIIRLIHHYVGDEAVARR